MAATASSSSARRTAVSSAPSPPPPTFSWQKALERDVRVPQMHQFMEQILHANFPAVAQKLRKEEPPARRYAPPAPPHQQANRPTAPVANGRLQTSVERASVSQTAPAKLPVSVAPSHPSAFQLHGYTSESSSEVDMREVDPMDELSDFETQPLPAPANGGGKDRHVQSRAADTDGDDEMNGGGANDFEMEGGDADVRGLLLLHV